MKTALIIHGHFYQPPRENPFTGLVPDQESAGSYVNWNEAVYKTCYRPNAFSRYLGSNGKVKNIRNNYNSISFNMGPSLIKWLKEEHPNFIQKLKEADRTSLNEFGHSNIIAQAYSHTILPLDFPLIRKLDIQWAILDYINLFGHSPEGFWCPECAIDLNTIDDLTDAGIKFLILSPWQASKIAGKSLNGKPAPCDRPFTVKGIKSRINVFFYDPDFASGISFGHLLRDADALYKKLVLEKKRRQNPSLINWATDGEIYGHHEAFGDMALAALIEKINNGNDFELTNYGSYLEKFPATEEAELWLGEDGKGSSWSCCHGVGRWERNCGCHTGGSDSWNQLWRAPMRKAFDSLGSKALKVVLSRISEIIDTPDTVLVSYGDVLCGKISLSDFLEIYSLPYEKSHELAVLLDMTKNIVNMYTSCGWFFNDISGIEPIQDMTYALYVAKALSSFTNNDETAALLKDLSKAKSNLPEEGNGKKILLKSVSQIPTSVMAASFFILNRHFADESDYVNDYGFFELKDIDNSSLSLLKKTTFESYSFTYSSQQNNENKIELSVSSKTDNYTINTSQISKRTLRIISCWIENKLSNCIKPDTFNKLLKSMDEYIQITTENTSAIKASVFWGNIGIFIKALSSQIINKSELSWSEKIYAIQQICNITNKWGSPNIKKLLLLEFDNQMNITAQRIADKGLNDEESMQLLDILKTARNNGFMPDITALQDVIFSYLFKKPNIGISASSIKQLAEDLNFS